MLLNTNAPHDPRLVSMTPRQCWVFIKTACYSSEFDLEELDKRIQRFCEITPSIRKKFVDNSLFVLGDNHSLIWNCHDLVRFTPGRQNRRSDEVGLGDGYTYLIQAGDGGPIKIGSTRKNPLERLAALQTAHHEQLHILGIIGGTDAERNLHKRFADWRLHGEWFSAEAPGIDDCYIGYQE